MPEFTKEQLQAIESRKGTILVSAAAGSGKTTVLVERVIRRLEDRSAPCSADRLLIVTFTKAATAQMKEKIASELDKRLEADPENVHLLRQRMLLPFAHISTIDGFCGELVRENFHQLGISPDFKILDEAELDVMRSDAIDKVINLAYKENSPEFRNLLSLFVSGSDDRNLANIVLSIFRNSRAFPFPDKWLDSLITPFEEEREPEDSMWGKVILDYIADMVDYCLRLTKKITDMFSYECEMADAYGPVFYYYKSYLTELKDKLESATWEEIFEHVSKFNSGRLGSVPKGCRTVFTESAKTVKSEISDIMNKKIPPLFCSNGEEFKDDIEFLLPVVKELVRLVKAFSQEFNAIKAAGNGMDFNDVVDYTLKLLIEDVDDLGNPVKTPLAKSISEQFDEILVDEFQDINETQNMLFKAVSKDESNLFMVGDVKQSIYRFRQAMPDIFLKKKDSLEPYVENNYPAKIILDFNFRSRSGVTNYVNFVFSQLMSKKAGELDYTFEEELKPKALFPEKEDPDAELHFISHPEIKVDRAFEAEYIAKYIKECIDSGMTVTVSGTSRKATYRDFCILLRSTKNKAEIYSAVLSKAGVPCHISSKNGFFDATEIKTALALIKTVDNPLQDIPLVTVLLSPMFGFTPDILAKLRIDSRGTSYYSCVKKGAEKGNRKCIEFLSVFERLRTLSTTLGAGEFIREALDFTGYDAYVCAMTDGSRRKANLSLLLDYATKYERAGHIGISGFIRFFDRVEKQKGDVETANEISENADVVRIMSIHKSKGLEFPICILADCSGRFNDDFTKENVLLHPEFGIGLKRIDGYRKYETIPQKALRLAQLRSQRSEELRVLYVAMTRAKEKLVCILRDGNPHKRIAEACSYALSEKVIPPYKVLSAKSMGEWLLLASVRHLDFSESVSFLTVDKITSDSNIKFVQEYEPEFSDEAKDAVSCGNVDKELYELLSQRLSFEYPYGNLSDIVAKVSPSQLENTGDSLTYFAKSKPGFITKDGMNSASRGTAVHKFMEFFDYHCDDDVASQAERMVKDKKLSSEEKEVLDFKSLKRFFESDIAKDIRNSDRLVREKKITFTVAAKEFYPEVTDDTEQIVVQGYIDCAFIKNNKWTIVDYKTDKVDSCEILKERYYNQLKMYERALHECTGIPVEATVIYSLSLGQSIQI